MTRNGLRRVKGHLGLVMTEQRPVEPTQLHKSTLQLVASLEKTESVCEWLRNHNVGLS